jgi:hypothetical protein
MSKKIKIVQGLRQRYTKLIDNFVAINSKSILIFTYIALLTYIQKRKYDG